MTAVASAASLAGKGAGISAAGWGGIASILGMGAQGLGLATKNKNLMQIGSLISTFAKVPGAFQTPGRSQAEPDETEPKVRDFGRTDEPRWMNLETANKFLEGGAPTGLAGALVSGKNNKPNIWSSGILS